MAGSDTQQFVNQGIGLLVAWAASLVGAGLGVALDALFKQPDWLRPRDSDRGAGDADGDAMSEVLPRGLPLRSARPPRWSACAAARLPIRRRCACAARPDPGGGHHLGDDGRAGSSRAPERFRVGRPCEHDLTFGSRRATPAWAGTIAHAQLTGT